ncbi:MAG TPA: Crp/Fnr family transcriptional regulator [Solirubrobacteraceae bacterium]|jgi:CRP-like cAMP-binding protein|nr:Crp/Fnr family transcriptional regulator [Solirubrobacteraceae bacterium]
MAPDQLIAVLEEDPELGETLAPERLAGARAHARARSLHVESVLPGGWPAEVRHGLGLLVLGGLLIRRVGLEGRFGAELLGHGDLLRPWQTEEGAASIPQSSAWRVLQRARIAVLDLEFARRIAAYPELHGQLIARALRRSRHMAVGMAIMHQPKVETRLLLLLWQLADRWGKVRTDGVLLPVRLTHVTLSELIGARRPTVSGALGALERDGHISRNAAGWVLHGAPPGGVETAPAAGESREAQTGPARGPAPLASSWRAH